MMTPDAMRDRAIETLHTIFDPEIPIDIYELGLIYEVRVVDGQDLHVIMTLTTPNCPSAQSLPAEVESKLKQLDGVGTVTVQITFEPPWDKTMMSEAALFQIGLF
jgi:FeS assembly SUF system protein